MFSVSPAEIATIAVVALLVFGPHRLPEIAKKMGKLGRELNKAAQELKTGIERELEETKKPLDDVRRSLGATISDTTPPDAPTASDTPPSAPDETVSDDTSGDDDKSTPS